MRTAGLQGPKRGAGAARWLWRGGATAAAVICLVGLGAGQARAVIIDQANIPASFASGQCYNTSFAGNLPMGESFTPTLNAIQFADLYIDDAGSDIGPGANFILNIRSSSITGTIVGTSVNTFVPDGTNTGGGNILTRFNFTSAVPLTPGAQYVMEIQQVGTIVPGNENFLWCGDLIGAGAYANGTAIRGGSAVAADDFWFREGVLSVAAPEPSSLVLVAFGAVALATCGRRRWVRRAG